jgi:RNA polymerase sigma-70 factor, ECF subfamily
LIISRRSQKLLLERDAQADREMRQEDAPRVALNDDDFRAALTGVVPQLRAFARTLTSGSDSADDLVQEALLRAWNARAAFAAGTNFRAWMFIILRNIFLSQTRRNRFRGEWDDAVADQLLAAPAPQNGAIALADVYRAMQSLPDAQREALILIGAGGFSYEEAAEICGVAVGTIKSRVARARVALEQMIAAGALPQRQASDLSGEAAMAGLLDEVDAISAGQR